MCMIDGAERCELWRQSRIRAAHKEHNCSECGRIIRVKEPYLHIFYIYERNPEAFSICQHCEVAADWLTHNCDGFLVPGIFEDIEQHCEEGFVLSLRRLLWGMQHKWMRKGRPMALPKYPPDYEDS